MRSYDAESLLRRTLAVLLACLSIGIARPLQAQSSSSLTVLDFAAGSEAEQYLRVLQLAGRVPLYPWSIRSFSRREIERLVSIDTVGPGSLRDRFSKSHLAAGPLTLSATFNSAYPYGANDGPLWAGRGLTLAASGGVSGHAGPLSFAVAPMVFRAANRPFALQPNGRSGRLAFNHGSFPGSVDLPQRFGDGPYSRIDPGNSYVRFDSRFLAAGVSTANEWIGPAIENPFLLGNNAPGFPHVFLGTGEPINLWVGRLHGRVLWGRLNQSEYSPVTGTTRYLSNTQSGTLRLAAAGEVVFMPRGLSGLELGLGRFFHVPYRPGRPNWEFWRKPFRLFFTKNEYAQGDTVGRDNQLASVFFRWAFPKSHLEIYGERGYEDQIYDFREFIQNIDHDREYMLGFQKVFTPTAGGFSVLRAEVVNYQLTPLSRIRAEGFVYVHGPLRQGHTNRGQLLGASAGVHAAAASTLSWTRYSTGHSTGATFRRIVRNQRGNFQRTGIVDPKGSDVLIAGGLERMLYRRKFDFGGKVEFMEELNRNFSSDVSNLNLQLTARWHP